GGRIKPADFLKAGLRNTIDLHQEVKPAIRVNPSSHNIPPFSTCAMDDAHDDKFCGDARRQTDFSGHFSGCAPIVRIGFEVALAITRLPWGPAGGRAGPPKPT